MVVEPSESLFNDMMRKVNTLYSYTGGLMHMLASLLQHLFLLIVEWYTYPAVLVACLRNGFAFDDYYLHKDFMWF